MALRSLNQFRKLRNLIVSLRRSWLRRVHGLVLDDSVSISLSSRFRPHAHGSISVGSETLIAFKALLYTFDTLTGEGRPIRIGRRCFIGGGSMILPGVTIGDESIVGAGSVVIDDVPPRCIVGGNPARVLRTGIEVGRFGRLAGADDNSRRLWRA